MRSSAADAPTVRFVIDLRTTEDGATGRVQRAGATAVPFSSWLELLALLEPPGSDDRSPQSPASSSATPA